MLDYIILTEEEKNKLYKLCPVDGEFFSMKNISLSHFVLKIESGASSAGGVGDTGSLTFEYSSDVENKKVWVNVGSFCQLEGEVKHKEGVGYVLGVTGVKKIVELQTVYYVSYLWQAIVRQLVDTSSASS